MNTVFFYCYYYICLASFFRSSGDEGLTRIQGFLKQEWVLARLNIELYLVGEYLGNQREEFNERMKLGT